VVVKVLLLVELHLDLERLSDVSPKRLC
jgi:hypothetical protein